MGAAVERGIHHVEGWCFASAFGGYTRPRFCCKCSQLSGPGLGLPFLLLQCLNWVTIAQLMDAHLRTWRVGVHAGDQARLSNRSWETIAVCSGGVCKLPSLAPHTLGAPPQTSCDTSQTSCAL